MKHIYIVVNESEVDDIPNKVIYVTDNAEKAREVYKELYNLTEKAIGLEDYYPYEVQNNWENLSKWSFEEFKDIFLKGINDDEDVQRRLEEYGFDFTDESIRIEFEFLKLNLISPEFNIYQFEFEKPYESISELCINAVDLWH